MDFSQAESLIERALEESRRLLNGYDGERPISIEERNRGKKLALGVA
jgi:hypothetical protein